MIDFLANAVLFLFIMGCVQLFMIMRLSFKVGYYMTKLNNRSIEDGVKDMAWWKIWMN
jgi:hypothetical protein